MPVFGSARLRSHRAGGGREFGRGVHTCRFVFEDRFTRGPLEFFEEPVAFDFVALHQAETAHRGLSAVFLRMFRHSARRRTS